MSAEADVGLKDFKNIFSLDGKVAVVTGGSRGLGLHAASGLLQSGCSQVFITSRKEKACKEAIDALNALGCKGKAISIPADLSKSGEVERLVKEVEKHTDHVEILLANAGASWGAKFDEHPEDAFAKVMHLNVQSVFVTIQKFAPLLRKKASLEDPSRVIVTGSAAGIGIGSVGDNGTYGYSASKAAVLHLARNLAVELGPQYILVNSLAPGFFPTKMASGLIELSGGQKKMAEATPNQRLGHPEDIAGTVVYLCSRGGGHVNGCHIVLDGGSVLNAKL